MAYNILEGNFTRSPLLERLFHEKESANELQKRKHEDWTENYELYRNKVKTNRLTQRQAVNIPLMKETVKTLLSKIDEKPEIEWKENAGELQKQLIFQEIWNETENRNNIELLDILDKKNVLLYGLSCKKLNLNTKDGWIDISVLDPYDIVFDPLTNPWALDSSRFIIHQNIFRSVREILADDRYSSEGKEELKVWADSEPGITQSTQNKELWEKKMERLRSMGINHQDFDLFAGGDRLVNLTEHYTTVWNKKNKDWEKRVVVYAEDTIELLDETLENLIGVDFWPFVAWSEDPEINEIYPDSIADLVRTPNKVLNVWFSQLLENRTLKNFQMHWFLPSSNYTPQTYTPGPGAMLPSPPGDDINKVIKPVEVSGLEDTLQAIQTVTQIVERGTAATAIQKGEHEKGVQTLGEVQILVGKAQERTVGIAKFYRIAWKELALKWSKILEQNAPKLVKLSKISKSGKLYSRTFLRKDWKSEDGYTPIVRSSSEQEVENTKGIQKFLFILSQFPNNFSLRKIAQKRMLEIVDLSPEEIKQIEEEEERLKGQIQAQGLQGAQQGLPQAGGMQQGGMGEIQQRIGELTNLAVA